MLLKNDNNIYANKIYKKLLGLRARIIHKCDNPKDSKYSVYGGRGVTYDKKWVDKKEFIIDALSITGFNSIAYLKGNIQLDKDLKDPYAMIYSKDTCTWVSNEENETKKPSRWKDYYAYSYEKDTLYKFCEIQKFSSSVGINRTAINRSIYRNINRAGRATPTTSMGWVFWDDSFVPENYFEYEVSNIKGNMHIRSLNQSKVEKMCGIGSSAFNRMMKNNQHYHIYKGKYLLKIHKLNMLSPKYVININ